MEAKADEKRGVLGREPCWFPSNPKNGCDLDGVGEGMGEWWECASRAAVGVPGGIAPCCCCSCAWACAWAVVTMAEKADFDSVRM